MIFDPTPPFEIAYLIAVAFCIVVGVVTAVAWKIVRSIRRRLLVRQFSRKYGNS